MSWMIYELYLNKAVQREKTSYLDKDAELLL